MSKPDPSITANLLNQIPAKKAESHTEAHVPGLRKDHNVLPKGSKQNARSAEKGSVQGHTRSSNRGK